MTNTAGDVATGMLCPGDSAKVIRVSYTIVTAGSNGAAAHQLLLEHGLGAAGVALTAQINVVASAVAGTIVTGDGLPVNEQVDTTEGTVIQLNNTESAGISLGAILDISVLWEL